MDNSLYKDFVTPRGFKYHYFFSPPKDNKSTLLFLHGFPSTSLDWRHQATFFVNEGYGVIVPDLLGYGGTDKPTDPASYKKKSMVEDIMSLLDEEKVEKVFAIGHDWGVGVCSGLANYHQDRFKGFGFLAVGYQAPTPNYSLEGALQMSKSLLGYEVFGYWLFFVEDGADKVCENHIDSFLSLIFPQDPKTWFTDVAPRDALKAWVTANRQSLRPSYLTAEDLQASKKALLEGGLAAPLCWYKVAVDQLNNADDAAIPQEKYIIHAPTFLGTALQDMVCIAAVARATMEKTCPNLEVKDYDTDHWVQLGAPKEVNADLLAWVKKHE